VIANLQRVVGMSAVITTAMETNQHVAFAFTVLELPSVCYKPVGTSMNTTSTSNSPATTFIKALTPKTSVA